MSFVCDDHEFSCRINDEASICTAELLAIEAAIEYIWDSNDEEFMIITDSLSSLQALKSQKLNNPIVSNILHMCHYLSGRGGGCYLHVVPLVTSFRRLNTPSTCLPWVASRIGGRRDPGG